MTKIPSVALFPNSLCNLNRLVSTCFLYSDSSIRKIMANLILKSTPTLDMLDTHLSSKLAQQIKRSSGPYSLSLVRYSISIGSSVLFILINSTTYQESFYYDSLMDTINGLMTIVNFFSVDIQLMVDTSSMCVHEVSWRTFVSIVTYFYPTIACFVHRKKEVYTVTFWLIFQSNFLKKVLFWII